MRSPEGLLGVDKMRFKALQDLIMKGMFGATEWRGQGLRDQFSLNFLFSSLFALFSLADLIPLVTWESTF